MIAKTYRSTRGRVYTYARPVDTRCQNEVLIATFKGKEFFLKAKAKGSNEATVLGSLDHPNVLKPCDIARTGMYKTFLVFPYLSGTHDLSRLKHCPGEGQDLLPCFGALAETIEYVHEKGFLHLDIKPDNVLVIDPKRAKIKLIDFEEAVAMETLGPDTGFTATYVSPEHLLKGVVSPASDIYSFGISVYRVVVNGDTPERDLFGPFLRLDRNNYRRAMDQMRDQDTAESLGMVTPRMVDARIPNKGLANVIKSCIEIDPRERPSASEVRSELMRHI